MKPMADEVPNLESNLRLTNESPTKLRVDFQPSPFAWGYKHPAFEGEPPWQVLVRFDTATTTIHTYPIRTGPSFSVLSPKYGSLGEIAFEGFRTEPPHSPDTVAEALRSLPDQFNNAPESGLGVRKPFQPLISALRRAAIRQLVITRCRATALKAETLVISYQDFTGVAHELERIAKRFSQQSRVERSRHAHNELLSRYFPDRFPRDETPYRKGLVVSFLRKMRQTGAELSGADRSALVQQASAEAPALAKRSPRQLYKLQRDFELAGLTELIERFEVDIVGGHQESHWQALLKFNPFIVSMLFGYPIVVVRDQAHLGGAGLDGSGDTITDFLVKNQSTESLALVEIKKPDTPLTGRKSRTGRSRPSGDLSEAVVQVIDQRYELLTNYNCRVGVREAGKVHAVDCIVVAGRTPVDPNQLASFEMYRTSLRDVRILTFDEVLLKLRALRDYLAPTNNPPCLLDSSEPPF